MAELTSVLLYLFQPRHVEARSNYEAHLLASMYCWACLWPPNCGFVGLSDLIVSSIIPQRSWDSLLETSSLAPAIARKAQRTRSSSLNLMFDSSSDTK